jgi:hypothetical protein
MRALFLAIVWACAACSQDVDHPSFAPSCDPGECLPPTPGSGSGSGSGGDSSGGEELSTFSGQVVTLATDTFDTGTVLTTGATVSAEGENGSRVRGNYDGTSFQLEGVLKTPSNWFLVEPVSTGLLPTLTPVETRSAATENLAVGLAQSLVVDGIFALMGTERSEERAQIVLHLVDAQGASVSGVRAEVTAERVGYRTAGSWLANNEGTDDSGLIFLGNVQVGSALTTLNVDFSGSASGRAEVALQAGAVTVATVIVAKK